MDPILNVQDINVTIKTDEDRFDVVKDVSFYVNKGETLGIVGESGCGKSITSLSIIDLLPTNASITKGRITLKDRDLSKLKGKELRKIRGKEIAMIFQEPMTSLNPVYTVGEQIVELIRNHSSMTKREAKEHAVDMLKLVGIPRPDEVYKEYPHQLSGGMRQRIMIAMAMSCNPEILIADEPTTALDVTIQAQILELMRDLQEKKETSIILITHDLGVVAEMCHRVIVMYAGQVVEEAPVEALFASPKHPYTSALLSSIPSLEEEKEYLPSIKGLVPSPKQMPTGCRFAARCSKAHDKCIADPPLFILENGTKTRCWLYKDEAKLERGEEVAN